MARRVSPRSQSRTSSAEAGNTRCPRGLLGAEGHRFSERQEILRRQVPVPRLAEEAHLGPGIAGREEPDGAPVLGDAQTLASARVLATQALQDAARGIDWTQKKRAGARG